MFDALYIGATGMRAQQSQIDAIANNIANVNTMGFRRSAIAFVPLEAGPSSPQPNALAEAVAQALAPRGAGAFTVSSLSSTPGELKLTGERLDVAIDGAGFIEVLRPGGSPAYTRAGALHVDANGALAVADGSPLASRIDLPPDTAQIEITADGRVLAHVSDGGDPIDAGRIDLVSFPNPSGLESIGDNLYAATAASGEPQTGAPAENGLGTLRQGYLESSNVQMIDELVTLMLAQRAFEMNGRVVSAADQLLAITNSLYRA